MFYGICLAIAKWPLDVKIVNKYSFVSKNIFINLII